MDVFYNNVITHGGEGIVIRDAHGDLYKRKPIQDDDGQVIGYTPGQGKYHCMTGALILKPQSAWVFKLSSGLNNDLRKKPPELGSIVKFAYSGKTTKGLPRFARFLGTRAEGTLIF